MSSKKKYVLGKVIISWLKLHPGSLFSEVQEFLYWNLNVGLEDFKRVLANLRKERMVRVRKFSMNNNYLLLWAVQKKGGRR